MTPEKKKTAKKIKRGENEKIFEDTYSLELGKNSTILYIGEPHFIQFDKHTNKFYKINLQQLTDDRE